MEIGSRNAAARLGIKPVTVRLHCKNGVLKCRKEGRDWLIDEAEVDRYNAERRPPHRPTKPQS